MLNAGLLFCLMIPQGNTSSVNLASIAVVTSVSDPTGWCTARGIYPRAGDFLTVEGYFSDAKFSQGWLVGNTVITMADKVYLGGGMFGFESNQLFAEHPAGISFSMHGTQNAGSLRLSWDGIAEPPLSVNRPGYADCVYELSGVYVERLSGDANEDGIFDSEDLVTLFVTNEFADSIVRNSTWGDGDFTADAEFDSEDLVAAFRTGSYESGPKLVRSIPEPSIVWLGLSGIPFVRRLRRSRKS